jgi:hypothetical protein
MGAAHSSTFNETATDEEMTRLTTVRGELYARGMRLMTAKQNAIMLFIDAFDPATKKEAYDIAGEADALMNIMRKDIERIDAHLDMLQIRKDKRRV